MSRRTRRGAVVVALTLLAALSGASVAVAQPPDLDGETFFVNTREGPLDLPGDVTVTSAECDANSASIGYVADGPSTAPYPGTFHEVGTLVAGPPEALGIREVTSADIEFSIDSAVGQVEGTKRPRGGPLGSAFICQPGELGGFNAGINLTYEATITTATERCHDEGPANQNFHTVPDPAVGGPLTSLFENFQSDGDPPTCEPLLPTNAEQCKNGGWQQYGVFKNQGDCVSFVATGGKNEPGKNQ